MEKNIEKSMFQINSLKTKVMLPKKYKIKYQQLEYY